MNTSKLGVAVLTALAALTIGAASAQAAVFTAASYPAFVSAEPSAAGAPSFTFEGGKTAKCEIVGFGGGIESNGCEFVFHPGTGSGDNFTGSFDVSCPAGKKIVVTGSTCEVQIGAQTGLGPVAYEKVTAATPDEVQATFQMKSTAGFTYTKAVDGASCPLSGTGVKTDGVIGGGLNIKAGSTETLEPIAFGIE
jgi:hypothetical protein